MKICLSCNVESTSTLSNEISINYENKELTLKRDAESHFNQIIIKQKIQDGEYVSALEKDKNGELVAKISVKPELFEEMLSDLQYLESFLSIDFGIVKIYWGQGGTPPELSFEPESEEEKSKLGVYSIQHKKEYPEIRKEIRKEAVEQFIRNKQHLQNLIFPVAFLREGMDQFNNFKYIYAFYNFYFVLEDLYANGKFDEHGFLSECKKSTSLIQTVSKAYNTLDPRHKNNIKRLLDERTFKETSEDLLKLLFRIRGSIHHFGSKSTQKHGTPFNHANFESPAFFILSIVLPLVILAILESYKNAKNSGV